MEWEQIDAYHQRAAVFGGWLIKAFENVNHYIPEQGLNSGWDFRVSMTFVPDAAHEWVLEN